MEKRPQDLWIIEALHVPESCFPQGPDKEGSRADAGNSGGGKKAGDAGGDAKSHPTSPSIGSLFADKAGGVHFEGKLFETPEKVLGLFKVSIKGSITGEGKVLGNAKTKFEGDVNAKGGLELGTELSKHLELIGGGELNEKKQSFGVGLKITGSEVYSTELKFNVLDAEKENGQSSVKFLSLDWDIDVRVFHTELKLGNALVEFNGSLKLTVTFEPDYEKILLKLGERVTVRAVGGIIVRTALRGAVRGEAVEVAVVAVEAVATIAASPLLVVAGAVACAVAVGVTVYEAVHTIDDDQDECEAICRDAARQLNEYASSYGSTMRGKRGGSLDGNRDAAGQLRAMMKAKPGLTLAQAVQIAIQSAAAFEDIAYRTLLPLMRKEAKAARDKTEFGVERLFTRGVFKKALDNYLPENGHYPGPTA